MSSYVGKQLWWCETCNVPLLRERCENCKNKGMRICSDLKPMFEPECKLLENEIGNKMPAAGWQGGLWMRQKTVWFNGNRLMRLSANGKPKVEKKYLLKPQETCSLHLATPELLHRANLSALVELEEQATAFVKDVVEMYSKRKPVVSFSGGKDSTAVSYIVRKALNSNSIPHLFGDTTIEYPDTVDFIANFQRTHSEIPFYKASNNQSFIQMSQLLGPPSMLNAWCCSVFKARPIAEAVNRVNSKGVISFEGIRRRESSRRRNREPTYLNKKIAGQLSAYPILDWREIEVWIFILSKGLEFNEAYEKGFPRVGCMFCPYSSQYNEYLVRTYYPSHYQQWHGFLVQYATKMGKDDPKEYVSSGAWKKRVGTTEKQNATTVRKVPCLKNMNAMHFILDRKVTADFIERFKPFGKTEHLSSESGEGFVVKDEVEDSPLFTIKVVGDTSLLLKESAIDPNWKLGEEFLCVDILATRNQRYLLQAIERQIKKYQACVLCGACIGVCPTNAITINPHFKVSEDMCSHCRHCINTRYLRDSCVALHAKQQTQRYRDGDRIQSKFQS